MNSWPTEFLPEGTPKYPDGTPDITAQHHNVILIIADSSLESLNTYYHALKDAGWSLSDFDAGYMVGGKGEWTVQMQYVDEMVNIEFAHESFY